MSDPVSLASLFEAAEQAAVNGDFATASRLLAEAARAQEVALGPDHLDLANTLNNLAVAHERCGQLDAAEREYRRAHAIAARALPADDPLVTTSAQNLRDFCEANGRSVDGPALRLVDDGDRGADAARALAMAEPFQGDVPTAPIERLPITFAAEPTPPASPAGRADTAPSRTGPAPKSPAPKSPAPEKAAATSSARKNPLPQSPPRQGPLPKATLPTSPLPTSPLATSPLPNSPPPQASVRPSNSASPVGAGAPARRLSIPLLVALGAVAVVVIWLLAGREPAAPPDRPQAAAPAAPAPTDTPPAAPAPVVSTPPRAATGPPAVAGAAPAAADGVAVGDARLCTSLSPGYRCDAAGAAVRPGPLVFYTRLLAARNTNVVHRWYRGNELRQAVRLDVPARRQGFRTFSRGTVSRSDGEWRVELRTRDGQLLHTERFTVR
jgi:hypothetical protein